MFNTLAALGFHHMHSAHDRDKYVKINLNNVKNKHKDNFKKRNGTHFGGKYDYGSVMHYGPTAFSKNGKPTIVPKVSKETLLKTHHIFLEVVSNNFPSI